MNEKAFRFWLSTLRETANGGTLDIRTVSSRISNCKTVERYEGDLDREFEGDKLAGLLERLKYSTRDQHLNKPATHKIPINGDVRNGTATLRSAVTLYKQFRESWIEGTPIEASKNTAMTRRVNVRRQGGVKGGLWPDWEQPNEQEILALAHTAVKFVRLLNPDIVRAVVEDNETHRASWIEALRARKINDSAYLWERSPCAFPGVRRYAGSREVAAHRGHTELDGEQLNALTLDDNDYPKQLWSFVFRGTQFSKFGPHGYALAHLADHKDHNNRFAQDFEVATVENPSRGFYGLYTCPTNTVYIPLSLIKPTDFTGTIRALLMRRAQQLYGGFCNVLPSFLRIPDCTSSEWEVERFLWADPVGTMEHVEAFLEFRLARMSKLIDGPISAP